MKIYVDVNVLEVRRMLSNLTNKRALGDGTLSTTIDLLERVVQATTEVAAARRVLLNESGDIYNDDIPDDQRGLWGMPDQ